MNDKPTGIIHRIELVVNVTGHMDGSIRDWPSNVQDRIYKALEAASIRDNCHYTIAGSKCDFDIDDGFYVHVVAAGEDKFSQ